MSVTTTSLGTNTSLITLSGETGSDNFIAALDAAIVAGGWVQFDVSNTKHRVYRALNLDGTTYKYAAVTFDIYRQRFWLTSYESWDAVNHTGTNEVFTSYGGYWQPYTFNNCDVVVFANPRWMGFQVYIRNVPAPHPVFVLETTRDHTQDTAEAGVPCWGWMTPAATSQSVPYITGTSNSYLFSTPRTKSGYTGRISAQKAFIATAFNRIYNTANAGGSPTFVAGSSSSAIPFGDGLAGVAANTSGDVWDNTAVYAHTLRVGHGSSELQGRVVGMKASKVPSAGLMNRVSVPVDSKYIFDAAGTSTEHWVLPIFQDRPVNNPGTTGLSTGSAQDVVWNGTTLFIARHTATPSTIFYKYDLNTNTLSPAIHTVAGISGNMIFDGTNIYFVNASNRLGKWDTTTDTFTYGPTTQIIAHMCFDGTNLWTIDQTTTSNSFITIRKFDMSLSQVDSMNYTGVTTNQRGSSIACDIFGSLAAVIVDTTASATQRIIKVNAAPKTFTTVYMSMSTSCTYGNISWTGVKGVFDAFAATTAAGQAVTFDFNGTTPAPLTNNTSQLSHSGPVAGQGSANRLDRYGRGYYTVTGGLVAIADMESSTSTDYQNTAAVASGGYYALNTGTHIFACTGTGIMMTPVNTMLTQTAGQLLLPK